MSDYKHNQEEPKKKSMADSLSADLLMEILVKLPVKSLLRFRSVSKSWYSLISSSAFIAAQINHQNKRNDSLLLVRSYNLLDHKVIYKLHHDTENMEEITTIDFPFVRQGNFFGRIGSVNGVLCLSDDIHAVTDNIVLWNPVIRRSMTLPKSQNCRDAALYRALYGFGWGCFHNDYKIVRFLCPTEKSVIEGIKPAIEVFRLSRGVWEDLEGCGSLPLVYSKQAYLNGIIHWLAQTPGIMAFDVDAEVFRVMKLPIALQSFRIGHLIVAAWCRSLAVFEWQYPGDFCLWVMEEYGVERSWCRRFKVRSMGVPRWIRSLRKNGEVILVENGTKLVSYSPMTNQIRDFGLQGDAGIDTFHLKSYTESLVLLDRMDAAPV